MPPLEGAEFNKVPLLVRSPVRKLLLPGVDRKDRAGRDGIAIESYCCLAVDLRPPVVVRLPPMISAVEDHRGRAIGEMVPL